MRIRCDLFLGKKFVNRKCRCAWLQEAAPHEDQAKMESSVEMVTLGVCMIPCLLWKGYQDGNI